MQFTIDRKALIKAIEFVSGTVAVRSTKPILEGIKISVEAASWGHSLTLASTDLEISSQYTIAAEGSYEAGACCVDPKPLVQILRSREAETVPLKTTEAGLNVSTQGMDVTLPTQSADDFPTSEIVEVSRLKLEAKAFADALRSVFCAESKEESGGRWVIKGIYIEENGDVLDIVATTTRILAWSQLKAPCEVNKPQGGITIPRKASHVIERMLRGASGEHAEIIVGKSGIMVTTGEMSVSSRFLEGKFPPFRDIWPKVTAHSVKLQLSQLRRDMKAVSAVQYDKEGPVASLAFEPGKMHIAGSGMGNVAITTDVDCNFKVGTRLDAKYLCDLIGEREGEASIGISNSRQPVTIEQEGWKALIMPLAE